MFSLTRRKSRAKIDSALLFADQAEDDLARIALDEAGIVLYASQAFCTLSHQDPSSFGRLKAFEVMEIIGHQGAVKTMTAGVYNVRVNGHEPVPFHFDWLTTPDKRRILVGSDAASMEGNPGASHVQSFADLMTPKDAKADVELQPLGLEDAERFVSMARDVMIIAGEFGEITSASGDYPQILGYDQDTLAGMDFIQIFHADDRPFIRNTIQTLLLGGEEGALSQTDIEARIITPAGEIHHTEWRLCRSGLKLYAMARDVTSIKAQQKALGRREQQLTEAESIGRMGHWHWTIGEDVIEWSGQLYRMFGLSKGEFVPTFDSMRGTIHKRDIDRLNQVLQRAIIEQNDYDLEFRIKRPDGEERFIRCEGRCALDAQNEVYALYGIMQDMTEQRLYESELRAAKDAAEQSYTAKSQFLANMSHELRTPLNAIIGFSEMMQRQLLGPVGTPKYLEYIQGIRESGEHLLDMITDILDMSKIEAGKYDLDLEEINISKVIKTAVHMMETRAADSGVKIEMLLPAQQNLTLIADRRAVLQMVLNLLSNAVKFTNAGGRVLIECSHNLESFCLKVMDNGIGIPAHKLASVTRPFEQVSSHYARDHQGSGLGLAITKELAELHGGNLHLDSVLGEGTTVTIRLPFVAQPRGAKN
jgi:two-component system cell cycle sensor histidine kinase PleC